MRRAQTKITFCRGERPSPSAMIRKYTLVRGMRLPTAQYFNHAKKLGLDRATEDARHIVKLSRFDFKKGMGNGDNSYYHVERILKNGAKFSVSYYPTEHGSRRKAMESLKDKIQSYRRQIKYHCDTILLRKPGWFLKQFQENILERFKKPLNEDMARYVGIEIECIMPEEGMSLKPLIPFGKWVSVCGDGSIEHDDNEQGREIRVCVKRDEVRAVLPAIVSALETMGARVNRSCGLHVHLDQRQAENPALNFQKLVRSLGLLYTVIPPSRKKNQYCKRNRHGQFEVAARNSRYRAVNAAAYYKHKTIEVRLFGGTLDATKIINWIEVLHGILDGETINRCPKNFDTARRYWNLSDENVAWLKARQAKFGNVPSDTFEAQSDAVDVPLELAAQAEQNTENDAPDVPLIPVEQESNVALRRGGTIERREGAGIVSVEDMRTFNGALTSTSLQSAVERLRNAPVFVSENSAHGWYVDDTVQTERQENVESEAA